MLFCSEVRRFLRPKFVTVFLFFIAILFGAAQTWAVRHEIFSDGISYIEIAYAYLRGDWANAINPYWSPFYSWMLAAAFVVLRPSAYWENSTLHLVNFLAYVASLSVFPFFLREALEFRNRESGGRVHFLPSSVLFLVGYTVMIFAGLSLVSVWYCSPDMISLGLTLALTALVLRMCRTGGAPGWFIATGLLCGILFLARTASLPVLFLCMLVILLGIRRLGKPLLLPAVAMGVAFLALAGPFVAAISLKEHRFTIGDSGKLNYGWEIDGAARFAHWHGEPYDIGTPKHPTHILASSPKTYSFAHPIAGTYPPWFNPSYFYEGIAPKLKWKPQLWTALVNLSVAANLLVRSPMFLIGAVLVLLAGVRHWFPYFFSLWPAWLPSVVAIGFYCLVYVERRYIAANLVVIWMAILIAVPLRGTLLRRYAAPGVTVAALAFLLVFVIIRQRENIFYGLADLIHGQERYQNFHYLLAQQFRAAGLRPGDKVAYLGAGVDADWARLAGVQVVAEIPLTYLRNSRPLNNLLIKRGDEIRKFWALDQASRDAILDLFRKAGAKMLVSDGGFDRRESAAWPLALPPNPHIPIIPPADWTPDLILQPNTRYHWLVPPPDGRQAGAPLTSAAR